MAIIPVSSIKIITCNLPKTTSLDQLIPITYIVFLTKLQKRQTLQDGFALFKNDITGSEQAFGIANILQKHVLGTFKRCALELIFLSIHVQQTGILTVFEHIIMSKTPSEKTALQSFCYNIFINNTLITLYKLQLLLRGKRS